LGFEHDVALREFLPYIGKSRSVLSSPILTLHQILLESQKQVAVIVNEMEKVEVRMHQILAVPAYSVVGIELAYPIVQVRVVITALALVLTGPPEVFSRRAIGFRY